ncbi:hypothetical protein EMWEY_00060020 [Eimeria maxima]|uniref:Uncharacterized protein n=1 Tax=Eimeria maxima TaxID=5804 RepID=U6M7D3_EIMMA|nr:hypothetical protein EMWEY_00060020 [Eimeria maxima]CDJ60112.1 hypothetical protein EMWEY_00060020 [Eimeria maxima]
MCTSSAIAVRCDLSSHLSPLVTLPGLTGDEPQSSGAEYDSKLKRIQLQQWWECAFRLTPDWRIDASLTAK